MSHLLDEVQAKYGGGVFPIQFEIRQLEKPERSQEPTMRLTLKENGGVDLDYSLGDVNLEYGAYKLETRLGVGSLIGEINLTNEEFIEFNEDPIEIMFWKDDKLASGLPKQLWELFRVKLTRLLKFGLASATPDKTELEKIDISRLSYAKEGVKVAFDVVLGLHEHEFLRKRQ